MRPLTGEKKLRELRPGGGKILVRLLYFQLDERTFKIVAVAPESVTDASGFKAAVIRAKAAGAPRLRGRGLKAKRSHPIIRVLSQATSSEPRVRR